MLAEGTCGGIRDVASGAGSSLEAGLLPQGGLQWRTERNGCKLAIDGEATCGAVGLLLKLISKDVARIDGIFDVQWRTERRGAVKL